MTTNPDPDQVPRAGIALASTRALARALARLSRGWGPILAAAWYGLIFAISAQPSIGRPGPITGNWALNTGHALLFGLLALWILLSAPRRDGWPVVRRSSTAGMLGCVLVLGLLDELHQRSVRGRTMSVCDVITDLTGAACVLWICSYAASPSATERGARVRFLLALTACCAAGALATLADNYLE